MARYLILASLLLLSACSEYKSINSPDMAAKDTKSQITDAKQAFKTGNYTKAASLFEKIVQDNKDEDNLFAYAESLRLSGSCDKATEIYNQIIDSNPDALQAVEGKGLCFVRQGKFQDAAESLSAVLKKDATKWRTINALGVIYALNGRMDESMEYYNMAIDVSGKNPTILNNIGLSLAFSGDYDRGKKIIEKSLFFIPESDKQKREKIELNLALVYGLTGETDKAQELLDKYLTKAQVMNNLGFYAELANDKELAKSYLRKALSSSPVQYDKAWNNLQSLDSKG